MSAGIHAKAAAPLWGRVFCDWQLQPCCHTATGSTCGEDTQGVVLCCSDAVLCCSDTVLCCAVLRCAVLRCAVLSSTFEMTTGIASDPPTLQSESRTVSFESNCITCYAMPVL